MMHVQLNIPLSKPSRSDDPLLFFQERHLVNCGLRRDFETKPRAGTRCFIPSTAWQRIPTEVGMEQSAVSLSLSYTLFSLTCHGT